MREVVAAAVERFGAVHGAVHAAGVAAGGLIERLAPAAFADDLGAKAAGALVLADALADQPLDFVLYCSSVTALSGGIARAGYAAANAFLDALAQASARGAAPYTVSVSFGRWRGVGMAARAEAQLRAAGLDDAVQGGMSIEQGQEVVHRILGQVALRHVIVSRRPLRGLPVDDERATLTRLLGGAAATSAAPPRVGDAGDGGDGAARSEFEHEHELAAIWARAFGLAHVDPENDFFTLGGESLLALQILNRIRDALGIEITLREFYQHPTLAGLLERCRPAARPIDTLTAPCADPPADRRAAEPALVALPRTAVRRPSGEP
jgi:phthiocerol/phenolphthiocerol synthesis type-I polyketide synthase E